MGCNADLLQNLAGPLVFQNLLDVVVAGVLKRNPLEKKLDLALSLSSECFKKRSNKKVSKKYAPPYVTIKKITASTCKYISEPLYFTQVWT